MLITTDFPGVLELDSVPKPVQLSMKTFVFHLGNLLTLRPYSLSGSLVYIAFSAFLIV